MTCFCRKRRSPWKHAPPMEPAKIALASGNGISASHPADPVDIRRQQYQTPGSSLIYHQQQHHRHSFFSRKTTQKTQELTTDEQDSHLLAVRAPTVALIQLRTIKNKNTLANSWSPRFGRCFSIKFCNFGDTLSMILLIIINRSQV